MNQSLILTLSIERFPMISKLATSDYLQLKWGINSGTWNTVLVKLSKVLCKFHSCIYKKKKKMCKLFHVDFLKLSCKNFFHDFTSTGNVIFQLVHNLLSFLSLCWNLFIWIACLSFKTSLSFTHLKVSPKLIT